MHLENITESLFIYLYMYAHELFIYIFKMEINTNYKKTPSMKLRTTNPIKCITDSYIELNKIFKISQVILLG